MALEHSVCMPEGRVYSSLRDSRAYMQYNNVTIYCIVYTTLLLGLRNNKIRDVLYCSEICVQYQQL